jgi:hypothetical protein
MTTFKVGDLITPTNLENAEWCQLKMGQVVVVTEIYIGRNGEEVLKYPGSTAAYYPRRFKPALPNKSLEDYM